MSKHSFLLAGALVALGCVDDPTPPSALDATGSVAGIVFFDRDNNGAYTPAGGDSTMADVLLEVRARGTSTVLASATTDAGGRFTALVPVGTHDLALPEDPDITAAGFVWCGARPSVYAGEQAYVETGLKFGCVIRIENAKENIIGATVTVAGVVTAQPGRFRNDNLYVQDFSGGIQVFGVPSALGLLEGDTIEVTGELGAFNNQLQLTAPRFAGNVRSGGAAGVPAPAERTTVQLAAATTPTSSLVGRLVRVNGVTVALPFASGNVNIDDGSGPVQMRLDNNANTTIGTAAFTAGCTYNITGILGFFRGTPQLLPRTLADVTEVSCPTP